MRKKDVITKEDIENYFNKKTKIKFQAFKPNNIEEALIKIIGGEETFKPRGSIQCRDFRARSIDDCILLVKYYFPKATVKEILKSITNIIGIPNVIENYTSFGIGHCSVIRKNNFHKHSYSIREYNLNTLINASMCNNGFINCKLQVKDILE